MEVTTSPPRVPLKLETVPVKPSVSAVMPLSPSTTKANSMRAPRQPDLAPSKEQDPLPQGKLNGLGLALTTVTSMKPLGSTESKPPEVKAKKPTISQATPAAADDRPRGGGKRVGAGGRHAAGVSQALSEFFEQMPRASDKAECDVQDVMSPPSDVVSKIKTLKNQIWEIGGDGKTQGMPAQQEHILYEDCMYICVHAFQTMSGAKQTEAYLWCGDGVSGAAVEDAQLFSRKIARDHGAKLEVLRQGKETSRFFQGLGGILITRRTKAPSASYMLCGRRHLGHVAFDEVDMDVRNLCSGFPYLVSARSGKRYLWKGKGAGADELGCARLIGMDLGLGGELEEVDEDAEPAAFFASFPSPRTPRPTFSELWQLKSSSDAYACRLYRVALERPKSSGFWGLRSSSPPKSPDQVEVREIAAFIQDDVDAHQVYLLDSYFEIYV